MQKTWLQKLHYIFLAVIVCTLSGCYTHTAAFIAGSTTGAFIASKFKQFTS